MLRHHVHQASEQARHGPQQTDAGRLEAKQGHCTHVAEAIRSTRSPLVSALLLRG